MSADMPAAPLQARRLILILTGGIAGYKAAELARLLSEAGASVRTVLTHSAQRFIGAATLEGLTGQPCMEEGSGVTAQGPEPGSGMAHIDWPRWAEGIIIAPASADFLARLAQGRANDFAALICLARARTHCSLFVAPAMNREMLSHPATQRNLAQVLADGALLLPPGEGSLACGETGPGRMMEPEHILESLAAHFAHKCLAGQHWLITAGPTREAIDPVRYLSNHSSGKMGFALARAAVQAGARVTLIAGPVALPTPLNVERVDVTSAQEMFDAVMARVQQCDGFIACAAVADWRAAQIAKQKIKKLGAIGERVPPVMALAENPDILASVAALPQPPFCVGFAAESENLSEYARAKREKKRVPLLVANLGPQTFGQDAARLTLLSAEGECEAGPASKEQLARWLVAEIAVRYRRHSSDE